MEKMNSSKSVLSLLKDLVLMTKESSVIVSQKCRPTANRVREILGLQNVQQAVLLAVFVNMFDSYRNTISRLAEHFDVTNIEMLDLLDDIQYLVDRDIVVKHIERDGDDCYMLGPDTLKALKENRLPELRKKGGLTTEEFVSEACESVEYMKMSRECEDPNVIAFLRSLIGNNSHLAIANKLRSMELDNESLLFFVALVYENVCCHKVSVGMSGMSDYIRRTRLNSLQKSLAEGKHALLKEGLVEPTCVGGMASPDMWSLTKQCGKTLLAGIEIGFAENELMNCREIVKPEDIVAKRLFYCNDVSAKVKELSDILKPRRMKRVLSQLKKSGMRGGFTVILHGGPGTGKTELVLQLAKQSGRAIMRVDIPSIRDKYVGETEKNIKAAFDTYRSMARGNEMAPILFFNECDALFCKRNQGSSESIEKMENALQDIILQEMETLEGILICTTNLTSNMDEAFERRFLYKIHIGRPDERARQQIWRSMLPGIDEKMAERMARRFDFTGGEMENVIRKYIIAKALKGRKKVDEELLVELCNGERYEKKSVGNVGFNV